MPRYIEEGAVYGLFDQSGRASLHVGDIDVIPRVDVVEVVHGRWRKELVKGFRGVFGEVFVCSKCGTRYLIPNMNYCPNCGAKMDEKGNM
jgi:rubrerythrin